MFSWTIRIFEYSRAVFGLSKNQTRETADWRLPTGAGGRLTHYTYVPGEMSDERLKPLCVGMRPKLSRLGRAGEQN